MAYTTIDDPSAYFQTKLYTGNGTTGQSITNDGNSDLQPDWIWFKRRDSTGHNRSFDSTRGVTKRMQQNESNAESTNTGKLTSFDSDGFTLGTDSADIDINQSSSTMVAWQWKANGGTRTTNTESGDNPAGGYQANTTAGFSIVDYVGTGGAGTKAHGLGAIPEVVIIKNRDRSAQWAVYHKDIGETKFLELSTTAAESTDAMFNDTAPTSTVFSVGGSSNTTNADGENLIAYCFKAIQGYSKFGSYKGNGNTDGRFVYLGFKPAYILVKATDVDEWRIYDHKRANDFNVINVRLKAHTNAAESQDDNECDFLSNGVKWRSSSGGVNSDGQEYIYLAFAEHPFVSSKGVPVTAR